MNDYFFIDNNIICFKQGNKINEWWICNKLDIDYIGKLVNTIIKTPDKKHKIQYTNYKDDLTYIEGHLINNNSDILSNGPSLSDFNIIYYNGYNNIIRQILIINLPQHNGIHIDNKINNDVMHNLSTKIIKKSQDRKKFSRDIVTQFVSNTKRCSKKTQD